MKDLVSLSVRGLTPHRESTRLKSVWSQTRGRDVGMKSMLFQEILLVQISDSVIPLSTIFYQIESDRLSPFLFNSYIEINNLSFSILHCCGISSISKKK